MRASPPGDLLLNVQGEECIQVADVKPPVRKSGARPRVLTSESLEGTQFLALGRAGLDHSQFTPLSKNNELTVCTDKRALAIIAVAPFDLAGIPIEAFEFTL